MELSRPRPKDDPYSPEVFCPENIKQKKGKDAKGDPKDDPYSPEVFSPENIKQRRGK